MSEGTALEYLKLASPICPIDDIGCSPSTLNSLVEVCGTSGADLERDCLNSSDCTRILRRLCLTRSSSRASTTLRKTRADEVPGTKTIFSSTLKVVDGATDDSNCPDAGELNWCPLGSPAPASSRLRLRFFKPRCSKQLVSSAGVVTFRNLRVASSYSSCTRFLMALLGAAGEYWEPISKALLATLATPEGRACYVFTSAHLRTRGAQAPKAPHHSSYLLAPRCVPRAAPERAKGATLSWRRSARISPRTLR